MDDYGVHWDEVAQRRIAIANADYIITGNTDGAHGLYFRYYRYYGVVFEMPLLLAERALGLQDTRHIYLTRHLITHLFFIAGGFVCAMLAYRMLGNRWIALFAMPLFLLHPRLYGHSFFNSKDVPFAATLLIALYLAHRAFRRDTLGAFLICGIVAGLAMNMRVFGLMLLPMILAMRALDLWRADRAERKRILATAGIFIGAALATAYITYPYYWENPLRFIEYARASSLHPNMVRVINLFMGEVYLSDAVPWNYIPVWFAITAPPLTLALGAVGCAAVCWRAIARPIAALRDRETRFCILLLGCFAAPVAVAIALQSNMSNGWRYMYFLWGPFCLLAAVGLHIIADISARRGIWKVGARLPGRVRGGYRLRMARRALAYGAAGFALLTTLTAMAALHPHQQVYFNALVDTKTPGALAKRYDMDYWRMAQRQLLERLLARYPDDAPRVWRAWPTRLAPFPNDGEENPHSADLYLFGNLGDSGKKWLAEKNRQFYIHPRVNLQGILDQPPLHSIRAYGGVIAAIVAKDVEPYLAAYADVAANGDPLARAEFDIYAYDGALYYLSADCSPPMSSDADLRVFLHITPADLADLPADSRELGFENRDFRLDSRAAFFDGKCIHRQPLPDYPVARIRTGQNAAASGGDEWRADIDLATRAAASVVYAGILAGDYGAPVVQSDFDLYLSGDRLAYLKEPCVAGDTDARFFLHIFPVDPADLPADSSEHGFANLDFHFADHGADIVGKCVAERELPDYPIERIRTGQFVSGERQLWSAEFPAAR